LSGYRLHTPIPPALGAGSNSKWRMTLQSGLR
jgi:hypothetical protein